VATSTGRFALLQLLGARTRSPSDTSGFDRRRARDISYPSASAGSTSSYRAGADDAGDRAWDRE
jgi:hypothetical protein